MPRSREKQAVSHSRKPRRTGFGVGAGAEFVAARFQFRAQFLVVVNLAVEDDDRVAVFRGNGLVARGEVDDFQPRGAQGNQVRFENALLVRPAVDDRGNGAPNPVGIGRPGFARETYNSTQGADHSFKKLEKRMAWRAGTPRMAFDASQCEQMPVAIRVAHRQRPLRSYPDCRRYS